jgi:hypothetical protein
MPAQARTRHGWISVLRPIRPDTAIGPCRPASTLGEALAAVEAALWRDLPSIPLFQHVVVLVSGPDVDNVELGTLLAGPFANAPRWRHPPR